MLETGRLIVSLGLILLGAEIFTNAIEWLGKKLKLSDGVVGSVLAAVGTALPETMIPIIAIFSGKEGGEEVGIGAILGAPFMLGTLALGITGLAVIFYRHKRQYYPKMNTALGVVKRDIKFFLIVYSIAILAAFISGKSARIAIAVFLVGAYLCYLFSIFKGHTPSKSCRDLKPLYLAGRSATPKLGLVVLQVGIGLGIIIFGAHVFVDMIKEMAILLDVPTFILALIIAPIATELPEKFNSIIWVRKDKDTLALGNITGAMVFQSSLIPALGITMTSWSLTLPAFISAVLAIMSLGLVYWQICRKNYLTPYILLSGLFFYLIFVLLIVKKTI